MTSPSSPNANATRATASAPSPSLEEQLSTLREQYLSDKHLSAARTLRTLQTGLKVQESSDDTGKRGAAAEVSKALATPFFQRVCTECKEVLALREALHERDDSWTLSYNGTQTRVWYRREPGTASHTILTEGEIHAPLVNVAALIYEAELYDRLFWYVTHARAMEVEGGTMFKRGAHIAVDVPWPLYKRDVAVYAFGVDALDEEDPCVLVVSRSMKEGDGIDLNKAKLGPRTVRAEIRNSGFELVPTAPGVLKARFLYNVDPHLSFVPVVLINWVARMFCRWSLRTLESRARDLSKMPDEYQKRIESEPIYAFVRRRLTEFWASKGLSQEEADKAESHAAQRRQSDNFNPDNIPDGPPTALIKQVLREEIGSKTSTSSSRKHRAHLFSSSGSK